jgi:DNA-binding response OmpR family regulator
MPPRVMRILVVGPPLPSTATALRHLATRGWGSRCVPTIQEAAELLATFHFELVLSRETLPDGRGYDIAERIARQAGTLLVGISLSEGCLWLPVIDHGAKVLGTRAIHSARLELEVEALLETRKLENIAAAVREDAPSAQAPGPHRAGAGRRKYSAPLRV